MGALADGSNLGSMLDTARVTNSPGDVLGRELSQGYARDYLTRRGAHDIAEILGLITVEHARPKRVPSKPLADSGGRVCVECGASYLPTHWGQRACGRSCGGKTAARKRYAQQASTEKEPRS